MSVDHLNTDVSSASKLAKRGIHLDLKGLPPTFDRLMQLLTVFEVAKFNVILVEWEDCFPWTVDRRFRGPSAYSAAQVKQFVEAAAARGFEVIPLVQSLGHLASVLRVEGYESLREMPGRADVINPLAEGASDLILRRIEDVLRLMPGIKYFHLGGDEAEGLGTHSDTKAYVEQHGRESLYIRHMQPAFDLLNRRNIRPILWHDMMHDWDISFLRELGAKTDLMVWGYGEPPQQTSGHYRSSVIERFLQAGVKLWGAGAYKGADHVTADLPILQNRSANMTGWLEADQFANFEGVIATAWSRYAAHMPQNEPIDGALDVLIYIGLLMHDGVSPEGSVDGSIALLKQIGEAERFIKCRAALAVLAESRRQAWWLIQQLLEQLSLEELYPSRRATCSAGQLLLQLTRAYDDCVKAADKVAAVLSYGLDQHWIEEYLDVRLHAIAEQLAVLEDRLNIRAAIPVPAVLRSRAAGVKKSPLTVTIPVRTPLSADVPA